MTRPAPQYTKELLLILEKSKINHIMLPTYFQKIIPALIHPTHTINSIAKEDFAWVSPLVLLSTTGAVNTLISMLLAQKNNEYHYYIFSYVIILLVSIGFSIIGIFSSAYTQKFLISSDNKISFEQIMSITAWTSLPLVIRQIIRMAYMLSFGTRILSPGLSGIAGGNRLFGILLEQLDIYLIWSLANLYYCSSDYIVEPNSKIKIILSAGFVMILIRGLLQLIIIEIDLGYLFSLFS